MNIQDLAGKNICILGFGREGRAMANALTEYVKGCKITIADMNEKTEVPKEFKKQTGETWLSNLEIFDVLIKSPGIPPLPEITRLKGKLTTPTQIFLDTIAGSGATVIGVTGSKGKSTTASLIYEILSRSSGSQTADCDLRIAAAKAGTKKVFLIGNIGEPAIAHLAEAKPDTIFILEMSSYQLMDLTVSPHIAVISAFFPEHLDYHGSLEAYLEAKKHITRFQTEDDVVFYNAGFPEAKDIAEESKGTKIPFSIKDSPVTADDTLLKGEHNLGNIAAAWKVCMHLGVAKEAAIKAIKQFKGLPHRLESLGIHGGIEWINDSISTTPESAIAALEAFDNRVSVIILGGQDRGYDFTPLAEKIAKTPSLRMAILLPESGTVIGKALEHAGAPVILSNAETIDEAVRTARKAALDPKPEEGTVPIVLLSPAAPSYGHFKNFEERGEMFQKAMRG